MNPWIVRNLFFPIHERLLGKRTRQFLRELEVSQTWPIEKLRELQMRKLAALVAYAQSKVPYFGKLFADHGITATAIQDFDDFARIPLMTRQTIRDHLDDLIPRSYRGRMASVTTSGATGEPLQLYSDMVHVARCDAARHRAYRWYGARIGEREGVLYGSPVAPSKADRLRLAGRRLMNTRRLRTFDLAEETADKQIAVLASYRPRKVYGYVSSAYVLALRMLATKARLPEPPAVVVVTAEPLYDFHRKAIEEAFEAKVAIEYSCRDGGLIAGQCPCGGIHLNAELNYVELGPPGALGTPDGAGEVVVTNLDGHVVPIIRYRTGDLAIPGKGKCACGRELPLLQSIQGRPTDFVVGPDGRLIHALTVIRAARAVAGVEHFRVHQTGPEHLDIQVEASAAFDQHAIQQIRINMARIFGNQVKVDISLVGRLDPGPSGKLRYVTSSVRSPLLAPRPMPQS